MEINTSPFRMTEVLKGTAKPVLKNCSAEASILIAMLLLTDLNAEIPIFLIFFTNTQGNFTHLFLNCRHSQFFFSALVLDQDLEHQMWSMVFPDWWNSAVFLWHNLVLYDQHAFPWFITTRIADSNAKTVHLCWFHFTDCTAESIFRNMVYPESQTTPKKDCCSEARGDL